MKAMNIAVTIFLLTSNCVTVSAQGVLGFFDQQATKKRDMAEQIALIETSLDEVKNGYKVTENGLNTIHALKNGTFTLHTNYFESLSQVNPAISKDPKVKAIIDARQQIITAFEHAIQWQKQQAILNRAEITYMTSVYNNLLKLCNDDVAALNDIITPGKLQMKDEERLKRIGTIYANMQDKDAFAQSFVQKMYSLAANRKQQQHESQVLKQLYNLN